MLQTDDIDFIIKLFDKATIQGLEANHKIVEVFLKLNNLKRQLAAKPIDEDKVTPNDGADSTTTKFKALV